VDELLIIRKELVKVNWFKESLKEELSVHDLGEVMDFLGCEPKRDRQEQVMYMTCTKKIEEGEDRGIRRLSQAVGGCRQAETRLGLALACVSAACLCMLGMYPT
jgi:hypothetical protein